LPSWTQTMVVRRDLLNGITFPTDMRLGEDFCFVLGVYGAARGAFIEDPLVDVRRHSGNSYHSAAEMLLPDIEALTRVIAVTTDPRRRRQLRRRLGQAWLSLGYYHFW